LFSSEEVADKGLTSLVGVVGTKEEDGERRSDERRRRKMFGVIVCMAWVSSADDA
jgi:hypothetical protein